MERTAESKPGPTGRSDPMRRRHRRRHHPERQPRPSLEAIVRDCGCPADELEYYVAFARELLLAERRSARQNSSEFRNQSSERRTTVGGHPQITQMTQIVHGRRAERNPQITQIPRIGVPALRTGNRKLGTATTRPFPDYSRRTKDVVAKWFRRGLSGHLMWLIGEAILGEARRTKLE